MNTVSVNIENLCVPCHCGCRHCLLTSQHRATGVDYQRGETFARKFYGWLLENRPDLSGMYYVGYCMDFPELTQYIAYFREQTGMEHLMLDGIRMRSDEDAKNFLRTARDAGTREIHLTFYGTENYHDRFAGRKGDFQYLFTLTRLARELDIHVSVGIMVTCENVNQIETLVEQLENSGISDPSLILPHAKGRGEALSHLRLTDSVYRTLPADIQSMFPRHRYKTEAQWLEMSKFPKAEVRHLTLSLRPENIDQLEQADPSEIIRELEQLDDDYYAALPAVEELARMCGQQENEQLFRFRDLYLQWQKRYWKVHPITVHDMNDERFAFSARVFRE